MPNAGLRSQGQFSGMAELAGDSDNFAAIIKATGAAHIVRALKFAAIGAFLISFHRKRIMAAAHVAL